MMKLRIKWVARHNICAHEYLWNRSITSFISGNFFCSLLNTIHYNVRTRAYYCHKDLSPDLYKIFLKNKKYRVSSHVILKISEQNSLIHTVFLINFRFNFIYSDNIKKIVFFYKLCLSSKWEWIKMDWNFFLSECVFYIADTFFGFNWIQLDAIGLEKLHFLFKILNWTVFTMCVVHRKS